ncbi:hypothetical protein AKJ16_DCAP01970 [Drosera capensis]
MITTNEAFEVLGLPRHWRPTGGVWVSPLLYIHLLCATTSSPDKGHKKSIELYENGEEDSAEAEADKERGCYRCP